MKRSLLLIFVALLALTLLFVACDDENIQQPSSESTEKGTDPVSDTVTTAPEDEDTSESETEDTSEPKTEGTTAPETEDTSEPETEPHVHAFGEWATIKSANCAENGEQQRNCDCGEAETQTLDALGHTEVIDASVAPTCTATGLTEGSHCDRCGEVLIAQTIIEATGHSFGEWVTTKEATTTEEGLQERYCTCGNKETKTIDKIVLPDSIGLAYDLNSDGTSYSVTGIGTCTDTDIVIPSTYNNLPVVSIGMTAFSSCEGLTSITIPDSVASIGASAFVGCTGLTSITIPDSVTSIGSFAFASCTGLTSVIIPDSVTHISGSAFTGLTSISVAEGNPKYHSAGNCLIETESKTLIIGCSTSVIPADGSVTSIGDSAFSACIGLTSITIPDSVTRIGSLVFSGCTGLTSISVEAGNSKYHSEGNCLIETEMQTLIAGCSTSVIPADGSVTSIDYFSFSACIGLTSITIPDSVTSIYRGAFNNCTGLTSITISDSITFIDDLVFGDCTGLTDIYYTGTEEEWDEIRIGRSNSYLTDATIHYNWTGEES